MINIDVINVNDLPEIVFPTAISINENTTLVGTVTSNDIDGAAPIYSLASTGDYQSFSIDSATGELIFINGNDAENAADANADNVYEITVEVSDGSATPVSKDVSITVIDVNEFGITNLVDSNINVDTLLENSSPGTLTGITASANDTDISDSVSYSLLQSSNGLFTIEESTGEVTLSPGASIDHEQTQIHTIVIQATSSDGSASTQSFDIAVGDTNDNAPVILAGQPLTILENAPAGQVIDNIAVSDVDTVGTLQNWTILGGNESGIFAINPVTGELSLSDATALNFEQTQQYTLQVQVSDGLQTATQTLNVSVVDVDEPPVINSIQHTSIEGFTGQIGSIDVTDPETGAIASFTIVGGSGQSAFEFGEGDQIIQTTSLVPGVYTLDVIVIDDGGISTEATLEIRVIALNDMPEIGAALPTSLPDTINNITPTTNVENQSTIESPITQDVTDNTPEEVSQSTTSDQTEPEANGIIASSENNENSLSFIDSRFEGSQARQDVQLNRMDRSDELLNLGSGRTVASASTVALDILLQNSESLMNSFDFDFDLDTINTSTTITPALLNAISDINANVDSAAAKSEIELELAVKAGTVVSVTLTVGIITWLLQTGAFLTTALSTAPLWRSLDPIPVLISSYDDEDDDTEQFDA